MRASWAVLLFALGCDAKATASDPSAGAARTEQKSREYESCGASLHCQDGLRCFDAACRRSARSTLGDYFAAAGTSARAKGDVAAAITAYVSSLGHYDAEKLPVPPDVDCAYGSALAAGRATKDHAELGARVLHRCVLAAPVGSGLRTQALADLALLAEVGLDPLLIGADKTADHYLTKAPQRPASDKLTVSVTAAPSPKSLPDIAAKLAEPDLKAALIACWEQYAGATKKDALAATVGMRSAYAPSEYDDEPGRWLLKLEPAVALPAGPDADADACVRRIVEPALPTLKIREGFTSKLTITVK